LLFGWFLCLIQFKLQINIKNVKQTKKGEKKWEGDDFLLFLCVFWADSGVGFDGMP